MKAIMVVPYFYPNIGGVENYSLQISLGLLRRYGWDVTIVTSNHIEQKNTTSYYKRLKIIRLIRWFTISNTPINPMWFFQIKEIIRLEKPNILILHSPVVFMADVAMLVAGKIPSIVVYHSGGLSKSSGLINLIIFVYEKIFLPLLFNRANAIVSSIPKFIKRTGNLYAKKNFHITPGVDLKLFKPIKKEILYDLIYVGRIDKNSEWKGIKYLLDAIAIIKDYDRSVKLNLVGPGDQIEYYSNYSQKIGISKNVKFSGAKVGTDLVNEIQSSKVLILPSISDAESFGTVIIEAMACKKPVIASNIGGIPDVISDFTDGLLTTPRDSIDISKKVLMLLNDDVLYKKLAENGYQKVKRMYSWERATDLTQSLIMGILTK